MKNLFARVVLPIGVVVLCATAQADTRIMEVWICTLNDGHTMEEVKSGNTEWLAYIRKSVPGGDVQSYVTTPVVGALGNFLYVDSYPSMQAWTAAKEALNKEEGLALEAMLNELATCESNTLYRREES